MGCQLFDPGHVLATRGALGLGVDLERYLALHTCGDWGSVGLLSDTTLTPQEDRLGALVTDDPAKQNRRALRHGGRIMSTYGTVAGPLWVITDDVGSPDAVTTFMLPEEYLRPVGSKTMEKPGATIPPLQAENECLRAALEEIIKLARETSIADSSTAWRALDEIEDAARRALRDASGDITLHG